MAEERTLVINSTNRGLLDEEAATQLTETLIRYNRILVYSGASIGGVGATALAKALETNITVTSLHLSGNVIRDSGATALAKVLETNSTVTTLNLEVNAIRGDGATALAKALEKNSTVTSLILSMNPIGGDGATALAKALEKNSTVTTLYLSVNAIRDIGATALAKALEVNSTVTTLNLGVNSIGGDGATALAKALEKNSTVTTLYLSSNAIPDIGAMALAKALEKNSTLTTLDLSRNSIGSSGATALAKALEKNSTLTTLDLSRNSIGSSGVTTLDLRGNSVGDAGAIASRKIEFSLLRNKSLIKEADWMRRFSEQDAQLRGKVLSKVLTRYARGDFAELTFLFLKSQVGIVVETKACTESKYEFTGGKLSVLEFSTTTTYVDLPAGSTPYVKILSASEQPAVYTDSDGVLTISPEACQVSEAPVDTPSEAPEGEPSTSSSPKLPTPWGLGMMVTVVPAASSYRVVSILATLTLMASTTWADAHTCVPTLTIEVGVPQDSPVTENFGDTTHYLAATTETVVWGYYDPNATAATAPVTMASGETITVEVITHHSGHDYAKMIRGDEAIEEIFFWEANQTTFDKPEPKLPGSGVHLITGPINVDGGMPGDVVQIDILELDPRPNPDGRTFGTNSQKFAGYQFRLGEKRDGTPYTRLGGTEAITVMEFIQDEEDNMLYGAPVYMYRWPNLTIATGDNVTFDGNPAVVVPHEFNVGYDGEMLEEDPIFYPDGFNDISVIDEGGIKYLSPDEANLMWRVPLRPHLGTLGVMPSNTDNYIDEAAPGGASTIPPSRFGGNVDDFRIGKGGTMYYKCELEGCLIVVGDTHAAQGDSELAGTAMEISMTTNLRVTLHKADSLPKLVTGVDWPLLETSTDYVVHGFAYTNYLDELEDASTIFAQGASIDAAMEDCYIKTRNWLMDAWDMIEEETIAIMTMSVDFGVTQVVDGNWGAHAKIPKFVFDDTEYDYSCHVSGTAGRRQLKAASESPRRLKEDERRALYEEHAGHPRLSMEEYKGKLYETVTKSCYSCVTSSMRVLLADKLLDTKLRFLKKVV